MHGPSWPGGAVGGLSGFFKISRTRGRSYIDGHHGACRYFEQRTAPVSNAWPSGPGGAVACLSGLSKTRVTRGELTMGIAAHVA